MPYTYKKTGSKYTVYKKSGEKVGTTAGNKSALDKYLAALHIHEPKKEKTLKKEQNDGTIDSVYMVKKPYAGCNLNSLVQPIDPLKGWGEDEHTVPYEVHGVYASENLAKSAAQNLYQDHVKREDLLEKKKANVVGKLKSAMNQLEKKRSGHVKMIQENPKDASSHKQEIANLTGKIDELVTTLERISKSQKELEKKVSSKEKTEADKKKLQEALKKALKKK